MRHDHHVIPCIYNLYHSSRLHPVTAAHLGREHDLSFGGYTYRGHDHASRYTFTGKT